MSFLNAIRLVTFDILHTIVKPRIPIFAQYSQAFEPSLGHLRPEAIKRSFKSALKSVQNARPVYRHTDSSARGTSDEANAEEWWAQVIKLTALGAGADAQAVNASLQEIVSNLMHRFSSKEGYQLFDDVLPTLTTLQRRNIHLAVISNTDSRMRKVLNDLGIAQFFQAVRLSEETGLEKPDRDMFLGTLKLINATASQIGPQIQPRECLHVGDEFRCLGDMLLTKCFSDYLGAREAGMQAALIRRPNYEYDDTDGSGAITQPSPLILTGLHELSSLAGWPDSGMK